MTTAGETGRTDPIRIYTTTTTELHGDDAFLEPTLSGTNLTLSAPQQSTFELSFESLQFTQEETFRRIDYGRGSQGGEE